MIEREDRKEIKVIANSEVSFGYFLKENFSRGVKPNPESNSVFYAVANPQIAPDYALTYVQLKIDELEKRKLDTKNLPEIIGNIEYWRKISENVKKWDFNAVIMEMLIEASQISRGGDSSLNVRHREGLALFGLAASLTH